MTTSQLIAELEELQKVTNHPPCILHAKLPSILTVLRKAEEHTVTAYTACMHLKGWWAYIPRRFFGRKRIFVCVDCCKFIDLETLQGLYDL